MEKVNLQRVKKLTAILAGKEKPFQRETHSDKMENTQILMELRSLKNSIMKDARQLVKNGNPDDIFAREIYLFAFRGKFHKIEAGTHKVIKDDEVKSLLKENPETELYYVCTNSGMCPLPDVYSGKGAKAILLKDDDAVIDYIKQKTGVKISKSEL